MRITLYKQQPSAPTLSKHVVLEPEFGCVVQYIPSAGSKHSGKAPLLYIVVGWMPGFAHPLHPGLAGCPASWCLLNPETFEVHRVRQDSLTSASYTLRPDMTFTLTPED